MKVLLAASEVAPIIKLGGLGDVTGSLPKALEKLGVNVDVIVPFFPSAKTENIEIYKSHEIEVPFEGNANLVEVFKTRLPDSNVDVLLLRNSEFFSIGGKNAFLNNKQETLLFSFFNRCVVEYIKTQFNTYDLIHCNDWHTGMITHILSDELAQERPATLFTIHNLMYQGIGDAEIVRDLGILPGVHPLIDWDISDGDLNFIQQGVTSSDYINTVSPSYAKEILTPEFGGQLYELLIGREGRIEGILNGIDYSFFPRNYDINNWKEIKKSRKNDIQKRFGLEVGDKPLISFIGRIDPYQKGIDIIYNMLEDMLKLDCHFALLGSGDKEWEEKLKQLSTREDLKGKISINLAFDVKLAEDLYAASDFLLVPSRYEPCGLIQMIAMWYGCLPIVHDVGGLKDSVINGQNGYKFTDFTPLSALDAVRTAINDFNGQNYFSMVNRAISEDFSWAKSAEKYKDLYQKVIQLRQESF